MEFLICIIFFWFIYRKIKNSAIRGSARRTILGAIGTLPNQIIFFDVETNGLDCSKYSVLSFTAIKYEINKKLELFELERINRYYYPGEKSNPKATRINGLTKPKIKELRGRADYSDFFEDDFEVEKFCRDTEVFVAHNIDFDINFCPFIPVTANICTMKLNTNIVKAKLIKYGDDVKWKYPTLAETANFYKINLNSSRLHSSLYDVQVTKAIFEKMIKK